MTSSKKKTGTLRITLARGWAGKARTQQATLRALGLRRSGDVNELPDSPSLRGSLAKVSHLVIVEESR